MADYQVIARRYRPQKFQDVVGQENCVRILKNAIKRKKVAHAYLFCGTHGTGKTTLARLFAKALNCLHKTVDIEPCNECSSCKEIASGSSFDVLEIDGASHRGIEDIRQINEGLGYAPSSGKYKIYLIDEVHMLTKEAFNALLKTLEEPPEKVKFFFATTESQRIPSTILSRCQKFVLNRISLECIETKLKKVSNEIEIKVEPAVLRKIAQLAEGSLRDAESLFDQLINYAGEAHISLDLASQVFGLVPRNLFFELDSAGAAGNLHALFTIAESIFTSGKNLNYFLEELLLHYRTILKMLVADESHIYFLSEEERSQYRKTLSLHHKPQLMNILEILVHAQASLKTALSERIYFETVLIKIFRTYRQIPIEDLIERLFSLEKKIHDSYSTNSELLPQKIDCKIDNNPIINTNSQEQKEEISLQRTEKKPIQTDKQFEAPISDEGSKLGKIQTLSRYETIVRFAAKELEGTLIVEK